LQTLLAIPGKWGSMQSAPFLATLLFPFLVFPWFIVVIFLGITPVTGSRLDVLADGILSRPITRYEYFLACWAARVAVVLAVFLAVLVPATLLIALANRPAASDSVTWYGVISAFAVVSLVLTFLVSLGFFAGSLLRRPLAAAIVLIFVWFPLTLAMHVYSLEELSLLSLNQSIPTLLRTPWSGAESGGRRLTNLDISSLGKAGGLFVSALSGGSAPHEKSDFFDNFFSKGDYRDFSLLRVLFGYGMPTLLAMSIATWIFSSRDL
jgi:ABC-type transport system involved in multi-copper enzyme maturation permease subunit